jgi:hypothetical protein
VLGLTALAASISPTHSNDATGPVIASGTRPAPVGPREVAFATRESGIPQVRRARAGEHVLLSVSSSEGGLVTIPRLGRTDSVSPAAPAHFDLLAPPGGRYDVVLELGGGPSEPRRIGTLVTRP